MGRYKRRTEILMPHVAVKARQWGISAAKDRKLLGLGFLPEQTWWRIMRSSESTPEEVKMVQDALREFGRKHNWPGWEEI